MRCEDARELLLEADLGALTEGEARHAGLRAHVAACPGCADALARLRAAEEALDRGIEALAATVAAGLDPAEVRREALRRDRRRPGWRTLTPLALAAAVAGIWLAGDGGRPGPGPDGTARLVEPPAEPGLVASRSHPRVAVLPTRNPDITVVWLMDGP